MNKGRDINLKRAGAIWNCNRLDKPSHASSSENASTEAEQYLNGYACFSRSVQDHVQEALGPHASLQDIAIHIDRQWTSRLSNEERKQWEDYSRQSKNKRRGSKSQAGSVSKKSKGSDILSHADTATISATTLDASVTPLHDIKSKPKKPLTAYLYFTQDIRPKIKEKYPALPGVTVTKELGKMWARLSSVAKAKYQKIELDEKRKYDIQMMKWTQKNVQTGYLDIDILDSADLMPPPLATANFSSAIDSGVISPSKVSQSLASLAPSYLTMDSEKASQNRASPSASKVTQVTQENDIGRTSPSASDSNGEYAMKSKLFTCSNNSQIHATQTAEFFSEDTDYNKCKETTAVKVPELGQSISPKE